MNKKRNANRDRSFLPPRSSLDPGAFLQLLAAAFEHTASIYNQTAPSKVSIEGPTDSRPPRFSLTIKSLGYRFEETEEGTLHVFELDNGTERAWARLEPQSDSSGRIVCWRERELQPDHSATLRTADGLSEEYLVHLLRRRLSLRA